MWTYILTSFLCFFILMWLFQVPKVKPTREINEHHRKGPVVFIPWGFSFPNFLFCLITASIPTINIIGVILVIFWAWYQTVVYQLTWNDVFPNNKYF